jgi:hypothetical protein
MSHPERSANGGPPSSVLNARSERKQAPTVTLPAATTSNTTYVVIGVLIVVAIGATYYYTRPSAEDQERIRREEEEEKIESEDEDDDADQQADFQDEVRACSEQCRAKGDDSSECVSDCTDKKLELDDDIADAVSEDEDDVSDLDEELSPENTQVEYERLTKEDEEKRRVETWDSKYDSDDRAAAAEECRLRALRQRKKGMAPLPDDELQCVTNSLVRQEERRLKRWQSGVMLEGELVEGLRSPDRGVVLYVATNGVIEARLETRDLVGRPRSLPLITPFWPSPQSNGPPVDPRRYRLLLGRDAVLRVMNTVANTPVSEYKEAKTSALRTPKRLLLDNTGALHAVAVTVTGEQNLPPATKDHPPRPAWQLSFVWPPSRLTRLPDGSHVQVGGFYNVLPTPGSAEIVQEGSEIERGHNVTNFLFRLDQLSPVRYEMRHVLDPTVLAQISQQHTYDRFDTTGHRASRELFEYFGVGRPITALTGLSQTVNNGDVLYCHANKRTYFIQRGQKRLLEDPTLDLSAYGAKTKRNVDCALLDEIETGPSFPALIPDGIVNGNYYRCGNPTTGTVYFIEQEHKRRYSRRPVPTDVTIRHQQDCAALDLVPDGPDL